jgi:hypothetical protein
MLVLPRPTRLLLTPSSGASIDVIHIEKIIYRIRSRENLDSQAAGPHSASTRQFNSVRAEAALFRLGCFPFPYRLRMALVRDAAAAQLELAGERIW